LTSRTVKEAMLVDLGSRDDEFLDIVKFVKEKILKIAGKPVRLNFDIKIPRFSNNKII
jgi:hypothetical protein